MPLWNWGKIHNTGNLDYMFEDYDNQHQINDNVIESYYNLLGQIPNNKTEHITSFYEYLIEIAIIKTQDELNECEAILYDIDKKKVSFGKASKAFKEYITQMQQDNVHYLFTEYYLDNLPPEFEHLSNIVFYHISQYILYCNTIPNSYVYMHDSFIKKHVKTREIKVSDLADFDSMLMANYKLLEAYELYFDIRTEIFSIDNMKIQPIEIIKEKNSFEFELAVIQKVTGLTLSLKNNTLSEYIAAKELYNEINKK
jgi:hypothetical protein